MCLYFVFLLCLLPTSICANGCIVMLCGGTQTLCSSSSSSCECVQLCGQNLFSAAAAAAAPLTQSLCCIYISDGIILSGSVPLR